MEKISREGKEAGQASSGKLSGLLPVGVFLLLFLGGGVWLKDFYAMPAVAAFLVALMVAFLQNRKLPFSKKMEAATRSMGDENVMIMCLIFVLAGAFSGAAQAGGGVTSTVNFGLSVLPPQVAVAGLFVIGCFISTAMGTSVGTIAALTPIAVELSQKTGVPGAMCVGAVVCGAMFGDNLSVISDTTIAATRTQGCDMKDKFRENIRIVWPAAVVTLVLFLVLANHSQYAVQGDLDYNLIQVVPYLVVLVGAMSGLNVFFVLGLGTVLSLAAGLITQSIRPEDLFSVMAKGADGSGGIMGMYDITVISILVAGIIGLVKLNGGMDWILHAIGKRIKSPRGAQLGIALLSSLMDISTANNTVAIVMAGPIAKDISQQYGVPAKRTASLLDIFTSVWQGILPYGAQILYACAGASALGLTPYQLLPFLFYPVLMGLVSLLWIFFGSGKRSGFPEKAGRKF